MSKLYIYPQTSCECETYSGSAKPASFNDCLPNNRGVCTTIDANGRGVQSSFDGVDRVGITPFQTQAPRPGLVTLNPTCYTNKYSKDFYSMPNPDPRAKNKTVFNNIDNRRWDPFRVGHAPVDNTPINSGVSMGDVYDESLRGYGKNYTDYASVTAGTILYYQDKQLENPYFSPLFDRQGQNAVTAFKSPMGGISFEYPRATAYPNPVNPPQIPNMPDEYQCQDYYCLSSMRDTQLHREDILAGQMAKINKSKYELRYPSK